VVVALRQLLRQLRVEVEVVACVLGVALLHRERTPEVVQELVALVVGAQLIHQPDHRQTVKCAVQSGVVQLVHKVGLQREGLPVDGVLGGGVPMHLVEVELVPGDHRVALGAAADVVDGRDTTVRAVELAVGWARLE